MKITDYYNKLRENENRYSLKLYLFTSARYHKAEMLPLLIAASSCGHKALMEMLFLLHIAKHAVQSVAEMSNAIRVI